LRCNARLDLCWRPTCLAIRPVLLPRRFGRLRGLIFVRVAPTTCLDSFTYCELRSVAPVALAHQSLRVSQNDNVHDRGCRDDGRGGGRISPPLASFAERPRPPSVRLTCHGGGTCTDRERRTTDRERRKKRIPP